MSLCTKTVSFRLILAPNNYDGEQSGGEDAPDSGEGTTLSIKVRQREEGKEYLSEKIGKKIMERSIVKGEGNEVFIRFSLYRRLLRRTRAQITLKINVTPV